MHLIDKQNDVCILKKVIFMQILKFYEILDPNALLLKLKTNYGINYN